MAELKIRVILESESITFQGADMETVLHPQCTGTNTSDWGNSVGKGGRTFPESHRILLDAAERASKKLELDLEVVDLSSFSFLQKRKLKGPIPRVEVGDTLISELLTSDEIIEIVRPSISTQRPT